MTNSKILCLITLCFLLNTTVSALSIENISGDDYAKPNEMKYVVSIREFNVPICGGSIVDNFIILTVAECFFEDTEFKNNKYQVQAGLINADDGPFAAERSIEKIYVPKEYSPNKYNDEYNIAVVRVDKSLDLQYNARIEPISLPPSNLAYHDCLEGRVAGFGNNNQDDKTKFPFRHVTGTTDRLLRVGTMRLIPVEDHRNLVRSNAIEPERGYFRGTCNGDQGNAIVYEKMAIALVTTNNACDVKDSFGMVIKVAPFIEFIEFANQDHQKPNIVVYSPNSNFHEKLFNTFKSVFYSDDHKV